MEKKHRVKQKKRVAHKAFIFILAFIVLISLYPAISYAYGGPPASGYFIQHGTTLMTATQQNVTIDAVNNISRAFVIVHQWMWQRDVPGTTSTGAAGNANWMMVAAHLVNESTIYLERQGATDDIFVTWMVVEALNNEFRVQRGKHSFTGLISTTTTATISTPVNPNNTLSWQSMYTTWTADDARDMLFATNITDSATIQFRRGAAPSITGHFRWLAVEWDASKVAKIEKGMTSLLGSEVYASPKSQTINVTKAQSFLFYQCVSIGDDGLDTSATAGAINTDTELIFYTYDNDALVYTRDCYWSIIDFGNNSGKREQNDNVYLTTTTYAQTNNFASPPMQLNLSLAYIYTTSNGDGTAYPRGTLFYNITEDNITYWKRYGGQNQYIAWELLELPFNYMPNVTNLVAPRDLKVLGNGSVDFKYRVNDQGGRIENCTLWGNFSGTWKANETQINPLEGQTNIITINLNSGAYLWNIKCYDDDGDYDWYDSNYTVFIDISPPATTNPFLNTTIINQTHSLRLNVTVTDFSEITSVNATLKYPNGTTKEFSLTNGIGAIYYLDFSDTNQSGTYNFTNIIAVDEYGYANNSQYTNLTFEVTLSPPANFNLTSPENKTESQDLTPTMTWQQSWDEHFNNYTLLIDMDPAFATPDFTYELLGVANTSKVLTPLLSDKKYYWRVIAYDVFGTSTNSAQDWVYITDNTPPIISLHHPVDEYVAKGYTLFNYTPTETNTLDSCSLYGNFSGGWQKNETNSTPNKGMKNYFNLSLGEGVYSWNVLCNDTSQNENFSAINRTFTVDLTAPLVSLVFPPNNTFENTTNNVLLQANATDVMANVSNCMLYVDGQKEQTNTEIIDGVVFNYTEFMLNGNYTWSVNCTDINGFWNITDEYHIEVLVVDSDPPLITQNYPLDNHYSLTNSITFNYTVEDATGVENCSLYFDDTLIRSTSSVVNFANNYFVENGISEGDRNWSIRCYDNSTSFNLGVSSERFLAIDLTNPQLNITSPYNDSLLGSSTINITYVPDDINLEYCELHSNFSGTFKLNETHNNPANQANNSFTKTLDDGTYVWKIKCYDKSTRNNETNNYTLRIDTTSPVYSNISVIPVSPANYSEFNNYQFNVTWQDQFSVDTVLIEHNFSGSPQNITLNSSTNIYNYTIQTIAPGSYYYKWYANDSLGHKNQTPEYSFILTKGYPILNLTLNGSQQDISILPGGSVNITLTLNDPSQGYALLYVDDELAENGTAPLQNTSVFTAPGLYEVRAFFNDTQNYTNATVIHYVTVNDTEPPVVTLIYPGVDEGVGILDMTFQYNVTDYSNIANCSLYINSTLYQTDYTVLKETTQTFDETLSEGDYNWHLVCFDELGYQATTPARNFTVNQIESILVNIATDKPHYINDYNMYITINTTDDLSNPSNATVYTDIIFANTTMPWWNASWNLRKRLMLQENTGYNKTEELLNLTLNTTELISSGVLKNDCTDLRLVDAGNNEISYYLKSGCNTTNTEIWFRLNLTASIDNPIYIYYNNSAAINVSNKSNAYDTIGETGSVSITNFAWATLNYRRLYSAAPVIISTPVTQNAGSGDDDSPLISTLKDITNTYFNVTICQDNGAVTCDPTVTSETLHYFVFDAAKSNKYSWIDVGTVLTTTAGADTVLNFGKTFANDPVIFTTPQTYSQNGNITAHAWTEDLAITTPSSTRLIGCVHQAPGSGTSVDSCESGQPSETVGYVAIDALNADIDTFQNGNADVSNSDWTGATFSPTYTTPRVMVTQNDDDGGQDPQYPWAKSITSGSMTFRYCESDAADVCNTHTSEIVEWFAIEEGDINVVNNPIPTQINHTQDEQEKLIKRFINETGVNGTITLVWNTTDNALGNYTITSVGQNPPLTPGQDYLNFMIITDTTPPEIHINYPVNTYNTTNTTITLNWTSTDEFYPEIICNLTVDGQNYSWLNVTSGVPKTKLLGNLSISHHYWNLTCWDQKNNTNTTLTYNFTIIGSPTITNVTLASDNTSVVLNWSTGFGAASYSIYISTNYSAGFGGTPNATGITRLGWTDTNASSNPVRYYQVETARGIAKKKGNNTAGKKTMVLNQTWMPVSFPYNKTINILGNFSLFENPIKLNQSDTIASIYRLNGSNGLWESVNYQAWGWEQSTGSESFTSLEPGRGYWLEMNSNATITYFGFSINTTFNITLYNGWSLVGPAFNEEISLPTGGTAATYPFTINPTDNLFNLWKYDLSAPTDWYTTEYFDAWGFFPVADLPSVEPGIGYYLEMSKNVTWEVGK